MENRPSVVVQDGRPRGPGRHAGVARRASRDEHQLRPLEAVDREGGGDGVQVREPARAAVLRRHRRSGPQGALQRRAAAESGAAAGATAGRGRSRRRRSSRASRSPSRLRPLGPAATPFSSSRSWTRRVRSCWAVVPTPEGPKGRRAARHHSAGEERCLQGVSSRECSCRQAWPSRPSRAGRPPRRPGPIHLPSPR